MKQPLKNNKVKKEVKKTTNHKQKTKIVRKHPQYGTSKLEEDFARDFLDKLGLEYEYQFEAKDIGRFYDFNVQGVLLEIDGDYWHSNPELYEGKELNKVQKKSKRIDEYKNEWALSHGFPIMRIWEYDIRKNPNKVMEMLKERFYINDKKIDKIYKTTTKVIPRKRKNIKNE